LYKSLYAKGYRGFARGLSNRSVETILGIHGMAPDEVSRIVPPSTLEDIGNLSRYGVVRHMPEKEKKVHFSYRMEIK